MSPAEPLTIPALVAAQASATPDAVAVADGVRSLTYAELDAQANRLAHTLTGAGVRTGDIVGVCLHRGTHLVTALLAIWRAGGAYLPVDPEHPGERIATMLRPAGLVLTQRETAAAVSAIADVPTLQLDPAGNTGPAADAPVHVTPADAAYVLHTSGSTGIPKPVLVHHGGFANHVRWTAAAHDLAPGDRLLQKTPLTFDAAGWEVFGPLVSGGTVVLAPTGLERDPAALLRALAEQAITVLQVVPSLLRALVGETGWSGCGALRLLSSGGEQLHAELVHRFLALLPDPGAVQVWNTYGPTECTIEVTAHRFDPAQHAGPVPIGRPIDGARVLVVDAEGAPVPAGGTGELLAGGAGVARGYLGRPAETAERFVPDPDVPGERVYRTGDMVRCGADDLLEYVGRIDHQVKVNGVRIEPGEIEAALAAHPRLDGAVVTGFTVAEGGTRLAAYVRTADGTVPDGLREFLAERLPVTNLPAGYVGLTAFPTTSSGKVDRAALPAPDEQRADDESVTRPRSAAEETVAQIWSDLLGVAEARPDDDFFALGGSSLQLTRLANRMRKACGAAIDLSRLMSATTLADQAEILADATGQQDRITAVPRGGDLPLSFGQLRMWVLDRMRPRSREWVSALFLRVAATVPPEQVHEALNLLLARHEGLRARFVLRDGEPFQVIDPPGDCEFRVLDVPDDEFPPELDRELDRGFDLMSGSLCRALLRPAGEEQVLVLSAHHIVLDGWSSAVLERDFHELLAAVTGARRPALPTQELHYADFAAWQRRTLDERFIDRELAHWRTVLDGATPTVVRQDKPRPAARDGHGAIVGFTVPATVAKVFDELGREAGATSFMTLLTAFTTLLARYESDWDVVVGTPVAGRNRPELENIVGFFLNNVVLRCRLSPGAGFDTALAAVRDTCREAFAHQELPFDRLVAELAPERDLSKTPLYQVAFDLHDATLTASAGHPGDWATLVDVSRIAKTDLTLYLRAEPDGTLAGGLEYATALFEHATVERMTRHFLALLEAIAADPGAPLAELDFVPTEERELLDTAAVAAPIAPPAGGSDVDTETALTVLERQAERTPDAVALTCGRDQVTFAEFDASANQLAHRLRELGVGPDSVVAVMLERGTDLLTAFLGVWKAGGAYLPLDVDAPTARIERVLTGSGAPVVITTAGLRDGLTGYSGTVLTPDDPGVAAQPRTRPERVTDPDLLAYVIYTSGSTGTPKGVQVAHRGLLNHLRWAVAELAARGGGGAPVFSSVAFDLVVPNLWAPLLAGQAVHLLPADMDLTELGARLRDGAPFSFIKLTPGHLEILSQQLDPGWRSDLAAVIVVAGQALPGALAAEWAEALGDGRLVNEYGPSEATVGTCIHPVSAPVTEETVPIGKPLPGVTMRVLDPLLRRVPVGVVGEVYVGGIGLARAYAGAPGMTADRFVPDPFGTDGARLYRTGDVARVLASGDVAFLGRRDEQVKIRGYRVEPGEVAGVLAAHPGVREATVLAEAGNSGDVRLLAFAVPASPQDDGLAEDLLAECRRSVPAYMVPASCTLVAEFPLTANGKLDRAGLVALAAPAEDDDDALGGVVEEHLAEIFAELLGRRVGPQGDFFQSGGNSILAIRLVAAIQAAYDIDLSIRSVFESPTVAGLAGIVENLIRAEIEREQDAEHADGQAHGAEHAHGL